MASNFKIFIVIAILVTACGQWVDDPNDFEKGYQFNRGKVLYQNAKFWWGTDSHAFTVDSFNIVDTFSDGRHFIVSKKKIRLSKIIPPLPPVHAHDVTVEFDYELRYGISNKKGEIVVFPSFFNHIEELQAPICKVGVYDNWNYKDSTIIPAEIFALLNAETGTMLTDLIYDSLYHDKAHRTYHVFSGDTLSDAVRY